MWESPSAGLPWERRVLDFLSSGAGLKQGPAVLASDMSVLVYRTCFHCAHIAAGTSLHVANPGLVPSTAICPLSTSRSNP